MANSGSLDASTYTYDAQNQLTQASTNGVTFNFKYDALNRQVWRSVTDQADTFSVWDGWNLIQEYQAANNGAATATYLYGATGLIADSHAQYSGFHYYYQDASGSTSHLADSTGHLLEWYRYDLHGTPVFYDANDNPLSGSNYSVRHLFTGQQWYDELGLYDLRNRFYSPDLGRFLQPDPIGFRGDRTNLYRYAGNNPVTRPDPFGLQTVTIRKVEVSGDEPPAGGAADPGNISRAGFLPGDFGWPGIPWAIEPFINPGGELKGREFHFADRPQSPSVEHPPPSSVPPQNPPQPSDNMSQALLPSSSGVIVVADAASGFVEGAGGTYSLMFGGFTPATGGTRWAGFETHGAFIGSRRDGVSAVNPRSVNQAPGVVGANTGLGAGAWFSNAQNSSALLGPFATYNISSPLFGATYSYSISNGQFTYVVILTVGPTLGGSYNAYPTSTAPLGY